MKANLVFILQRGLLAAGALGILGVSGCVDSGGYSSKPTKMPGFNPPMGYEEPQSDVPSVDPNRAADRLRSLPDPAPVLAPSEGVVGQPPRQASEPSAPSAPSAPNAPLVAKRVPGKPGWIVNPYTQKELLAVDEKGKPLPSGMKVMDENTKHVMIIP
ncbi:MAG: hypothetical protein RLZZ244_710 [Verrucomicrobiota bacterium]